MKKIACCTELRDLLSPGIRQLQAGVDDFSGKTVHGTAEPAEADNHEPGSPGFFNEIIAPSFMAGALIAKIGAGRFNVLPDQKL